MKSMAFKINDVLNIVSFTGEVVKSSLIKTLVLICQQKKFLVKNIR